jgi:hypothetical protein
MESLGCSVVWAACIIFFYFLFLWYLGLPIMQWYEPKDYKPKIDNLAFSKLINQLIGKLTVYLVSSFIKGWSHT